MNKPETIIKDLKKKKTSHIHIDMAILSDKNISTKEFDELSKYKEWK